MQEPVKESIADKCPSCGYILSPETHTCLRCGYEPCQFCDKNIEAKMAGQED